MLQGFPPYSNYKVLIRCNTFNQSKYIEEALEGFAMQQTDFPFLTYVVDDASTDEEQYVLKQWISNHCNSCDVEIYDNEIAVIFFSKDKINRNCIYAIHLLKNNLFMKPEKQELHEFWRNRCIYEALCEGDDYWTDPFKLQKQVDFLESHPDYSMCFHTAIQHWEDGCKPDEIFKPIEDREYTGEELFAQWTTATASVMLRRSVLESDIYKMAQQNKKFIYGDIITWLCAAHVGKIWGMSDVMSVYRRQENGAVFNYNLNRIKKQAYHELEMYKVFGDRYKEISIQRFSKSAMEAFWGLKANGKIDLKLLLDIAICSPSTLLHEIIKRIRG